MRESKTKKIALCGVLAALGIVLMMLSGVITVMTFAIPALAGCLIIPVVNEYGWRWGLAIFAVISVASLFFVADRQATLCYVLLFGYYPAALCGLQKIKHPVLRWGCKLLIFNGALALGICLMTFVLGIPVMESDVLGKFAIPAIVLGGNLIFVLYDRAINGLIASYLFRFRKRFRQFF